ncbi:hypothetical protein ACVWWG_007905 [Bradyrhizobium sp. LB7.2]
MNHSIHSADRATHMKIVVVALVAGITVAGFGIAARTNADHSQTAQSTHVIKAGKTGRGDERRDVRYPLTRGLRTDQWPPPGGLFDSGDG